MPRMECLCLLKPIFPNLNTQGNEIWGLWWHWKVMRSWHRSFVSAFCVLVRDHSDIKTFFSATSMRIPEERAIHKWEGKLWSNIRWTCRLTLDFPHSINLRTTALWFKPFRLWYCILAVYQDSPFINEIHRGKTIAFFASSGKLTNHMHRNNH